MGECMLLLRCFFTLCLLGMFSSTKANDQTIVIPIVEDCEDMLNNNYVQQVITAEPVIHEFDIRLERFVYGLIGYATLQAPAWTIPSLKKQIASLYSKCDGTASRGIVPRENGLVSNLLVDDLNLMEKYGDGRIIVIVDKGKDVRTIRLDP